VSQRLAVTVDASALDDARATAGIGRYVACLVEALPAVPGLDLRVARPGHPPRSEAWVMRWAGAQPALLRTATGQRARLVHATGSDPAALWPLRRQVVTVHDVIPWTGSPRRWRSPTGRYLAWQRRRFRHCAAVIAVSDDVAAEATRVLRLDERRVTVVPEGLLPAFRPERRAGEGDDAALRRAAGVDGTGYLLWTGSLRAHDPRKALGTLLDAVAAVRRERPDTLLVLAGDRGEEAQAVAARAASLGIAVAMPGFVSDDTLAALIRGAGAVTLPSLHEGFGLPALEAMACGAPLVASRAGNLPRLVGDAAVLVEPGDARSLAEGLRAVLDDPGLAQRLRQAGPRQAEPYTWPRTAEATVAVYRRALER
jgi:glycosyltransferase involved in cell wall biosynthesis